MFRSLINATTAPPLVEENTSASPACLNKGDGRDGDGTNLEESLQSSQQVDNLSFLTDPMVRSSESQESSTSQTTNTFDHSKLKAYRENLRDSFGLGKSIAESDGDDDDDPPTKKMVSIHDIMISDGSLTYDNIHFVDPEEQQGLRAETVAAQTTTSTCKLQDMEEEESLGYLVEALDLEEDHESSLKRQEIIPAVPPQADDSSYLSFHASEMTSSDELGDSISTTMSTETTTFNEQPVVLDNVHLPVEQHGLDVLMHVGNQLLLEETSTASPTPRMPRRSNHKWTWMMASLLLVVVLGISIIFCPSFQSVVVHQDGVPPTEWQAYHEKNYLLLILTDDSPKENETMFVSKLESRSTANSHEQIDPEMVQDKNSAGSSSWITAALGFLVMWMAIPKRSGSVDVNDDCREEETNACDSTESATKNEQVKEETSSPTWDFSAYEKLKVVELGQRLQSRRCSTVGRKHVLIQRLVDVYSAELETLTVKQLRPILKFKGCKQAGRKAELIQRLVEAGMQA